MLTLKKLPLRRSILCAFGAMSFILLSSVSYASKALIQDRRITMADAEKMAENAKRNSEFPIVVNDRVLKQLNRFLGTPDGREFISQSMLRMKEYQSLIEKKLEEYDVPHELIAIPLIEAGYKNSPAKKEGKAAGLWMFMPGTAAHYGLKVTREPMKTDERMDVALSTDAAMRLLKANQLRFKDWPLSVLAYNMGEGERGGVQGGINKTNSRDAWTLVERGFENDPDYLPKLMAAILILKNPDTLN